MNQALTESAPLCACGCGNPTRRYTKTKNASGRRQGQWARYIRGHWGLRTGINENLSATNRNEYMRQWRLLNLEECKARDREKYRRLKVLVFSHYSGGKMVCACCGENEIEFLTIDHIVPIRRRTRDSRHGGTALYARLRAAGFPPGYQVLCFNCNCAKGTNGECPHNRRVVN